MAIKEILDEQKILISSLSAIGLSAGPGSYTGLRVGMASAKGLCFALGIPLITVNTLQLMALAASEGSDGLLCPMIDARRMEVFTALYDRELKEIIPASNLVLDQNSFDELLKKEHISFFGNGSQKFRDLRNSNDNASFIESEATAAHMIKLVFQKFKAEDFANLAYSEPYYGRSFYSPTVKGSQ